MANKRCASAGAGAKKEYHAGCSNTSAIAAAQVNFKEMVGERE